MEPADPEQQAAFRGKLADFVRLYAFLSQVVRFADAELEKFYVVARLLRRSLPGAPDSLPLEVQEKIDMESYRRAGSARRRGDQPAGARAVRALVAHHQGAERPVRASSSVWRISSA